MDHKIIHIIINPCFLTIYDSIMLNLLNSVYRLDDLTVN